MFDEAGFRRFLATGEVIAEDEAHWHHRDTLAEHDAKYHGGMFKGGRCVFRQKGDKADLLGAKDPGIWSLSDGKEKTPQDEYDAVVARYKGTPMWMKAPNGKPTNLTERQWVQVRTTSFKKWFGDWEGDPANASKVVDENGEPRVVYHGSPDGEIQSFNISGHPIKGLEYDRRVSMPFFTSKFSHAKTYGDHVVAVFLNARNIVDLGPSDRRNDQRYYVPNQLKTNAEREGIYRTHEENTTELAARLTEHTAHDGIVFRDSFDFGSNKMSQTRTIAKQDGKADNYFVVSASQVKSATDNSGAFSIDEVSTLDEADAAEVAAEKYLRMVEDESLAEHDKKYHGGRFDPKTQTCEKREKMVGGDQADVGVLGRNHYQGMKKTKDEVRRIVGRHLDDFAESIGIRIVDFEIHGSRGRGTARDDSDLDVVFEYDDGDGEEISTQEDYVFNQMAKHPLEIDGIKVDFNPINAEDTGTLEEYMERDKAYDAEKVAEKQKEGGGEKRVNGVTAAEDAEYMDAVKRGDMETAARMVRDAAAKAMPDMKVVGEDGLPIVVYRGREGRDTVLDTMEDGIHFTTDRNYADQYGDNSDYNREGADRNTISAFLNLKNPLDLRDIIDNATSVSEFKRRLREKGVDLSVEYKSPFNNNKETIESIIGSLSLENLIEDPNGSLTDYLGGSLKNQGFDGIITYEFEDRKNPDYIVFNSNAIKSADPVTYDDAGNVIPLSRRFDGGGDIRGAV